MAGIVRGSVGGACINNFAFLFLRYHFFCLLQTKKKENDFLLIEKAQSVYHFTLLLMPNTNGLGLFERWRGYYYYWFFLKSLFKKKITTKNPQKP